MKKLIIVVSVLAISGLLFFINFNKSEIEKTSDSNIQNHGKTSFTKRFGNHVIATDDPKILSNIKYRFKANNPDAKQADGIYFAKKPCKMSFCDMIVLYEKWKNFKTLKLDAYQLDTDHIYLIEKLKNLKYLEITGNQNLAKDVMKLANVIPGLKIKFIVKRGLNSQIYETKRGIIQSKLKSWSTELQGKLKLSTKNKDSLKFTLEMKDGSTIPIVILINDQRDQEFWKTRISNLLDQNVIVQGFLALDKTKLTSATQLANDNPNEINFIFCANYIRSAKNLVEIIKNY